jgi:endonuclease YncB( thermonuclease family)
MFNHFNLWPRLVLAIPLVLLTLLAVWLSAQSRLVVLKGRAYVVDGDSFRIGGHKVRLKGLDAPEAGQTCLQDGRQWPCGREAKWQLFLLVRGVEVECRGHARDKYGRLVAICYANGGEVNERFVEAGWAFASNRYMTAEKKARAAKRGIWAGPVIHPRAWRKGKRTHDHDNNIGATHMKDGEGA